MVRADLNIPDLGILVEAGDWPAEAALRALAEQALGAALAALAAAALSLSRDGRGRLGDSRAGGGHDRRRFPQGGGELSLVFTDNAAIQRLNAQYRGKDKPTNVLSFPQANGPLLGDIVLAWETVRDEAALAEKPLEAHMAHLIVHGFLHLLGHDHEAEAEAEEMEALERAALRRMGIADPYAAARE